jgi:uncharacterized protein (DUF1919 family)
MKAVTDTGANVATKPFPIEHKPQRRIGLAAALGPREDARAWRTQFRGGVLELRNRLGASLLRAGLEDREFTVLSNDCWGQALYEGYGMPCLTPLVGAGMYADCFLRFLGNIEGYLRSPLRFVAETRYAALGRIRSQRAAQNGLWPIAVLGDDVEVHFLHFRTEDESRRSWDAGCERLHLKRIAVKFSADKDGATQDHIERFAAMPFARKLLLSRQSLPGIACAVRTPNYVVNGAVMFRRSVKYFDCTHWLNTGEIRRNTPRVWASKAIFAQGV